MSDKDIKNEVSNNSLDSSNVEKVKPRKTPRITDVKEMEKELSAERKELEENKKDRKKGKVLKRVKQFFTFCFVVRNYLLLCRIIFTIWAF
jgi:uncharacterized membrane protein